MILEKKGKKTREISRVATHSESGSTIVLVATVKFSLGHSLVTLHF